jgi:serine/threonine protein kinase
MRTMRVSPSSVPPEADSRAMGRYLPCARLGTGGMADVFLTVAQGKHGVKKLTVVKRLRNPDDEYLLRMFLDEARLAARLNHPNIVHTYEVGEARGEYFIAMEYLEGQPLIAVLKAIRETPERLSGPLIATIAVQVLKGLHYAHEFCDFDGTPLGIVHRDVSPHNLFVTYNGDVKVLDFGIAKTAVKSTRTETGVLKGKLAYMAPEQASMGDVGRQADVFSVGVVLWEMLARRPLFSGDPVTILNSIVNDVFPSPSTVRADVPPTLAAIAMKALERPLDRRYATAEQMRIDLEGYLRGTGNATSDNELARLMNDLFATTREKTRARIQEYVERMERDSTKLTGDRDLPVVETSSDPRIEHVTPVLPMAMSDQRARSRRMRWLLALSGVVAVAATLSIFAIQSSRAARTKAQDALVQHAGESKPAHVRLETTPQGALVEWNGKRLGLTPDEFALDRGVQRLIISRDGYETEDLTVDVKPGESIVRALVLRAKPERPSASSPGPALGTAAPWHPPAHAAAPRPPPPAATASSPAVKSTASAPRVRIRMIEEEGAAGGKPSDVTRP